MAKIFTDESQLTPGKWYAIGIVGLDVEEPIDWQKAQLLKYEGGSCWSNDAGEVIEFVWDPVIQDDVLVGSADQFAEQV